MIAPLRRRHRSTFVILAVATPALFLAALAHRPPAPQVAELPTELVATLPTAGQPLELFQDFASTLAVDTNGAHLTLEALAPLRQPDLLAYFTTDTPAGTSLPAQAHLLGPVAWGQPRTFPLPSVAADGGHLLLYSLPHQEVTAAAALARFELPASLTLQDETQSEAVAESETVAGGEAVAGEEGTTP